MDREHVKKVFSDYTNGYDHTDVKIRLKVDHTYRVAELCDRIARSQTDDAKDLDLAWLLGMLHDIGRFEQIRRYGTFSDTNSVDHAELGADILFVENLFQDFFDIHDLPKELPLVETAIRLHNKYRLPNDLDARTKMFCQVLRDADKIDILRVCVDIPFEETHPASREELYSSTIRDEVMAGVYAHECISRDVVRDRTAAEIYLSHCMLAFELVYDESRRIVRQQGYLDKLLSFQSNNPETAKRFAIFKEEISHTLDES